MAEETLRSSLEGFVRELTGGALGATEKVTESIPGTGAVGSVVEQLGAALPGGGPLEEVGERLKRPEQVTRAAQVLLQAGIIRAERPDNALRAARALLKWQFTPATAAVANAIRYPDEPAIIDEKGTVTFAEVDKRTNALARGLKDAGVGAGDSVAIMCRDHRWFVEAVMAIAKLGATSLLYNTQFAGPQLEKVNDREDPAAIIYDEEFAEVIEESAGDRQRWVAWQDDGGGDAETVESLIEAGDDSDLSSPSKPGKITLLTSGSTGTPKGASRGQPDPIDPIVAVLSKIPLRAREPTVFAAPLFHAWGFMQFNLGMLLASTFVLRRRFDPEATLAKVQETKATTLVVVPVMLQRILELDEGQRDYDLASLRIVASSGGALSGELACEWMDGFGDNLYNLYGSTEVAWAAIATPEDLRAAPGTSGKAPPATSLKIIDQDDRSEQPPGDVGEIFVGNQMLFEGYTGDEDDEEMIDGHMTTGDLGYLDEEGRLFVQGRADDMIVSGGENVYPEEVEEVLEQHDSVSEAAVIGVEDDEFGERLKAFVVKDGEVSEDDLKGYVKEQLANYKVPRDVVFVDELPRKPQGKVDKQKLQDEEDDGEQSGGDSSGESESE